MLVPGTHFEIDKGTVAEALNFCKNDGDFNKFGVLPADMQNINPFRDVHDKAEHSEITSIKAEHSGIFIRYRACILFCLLVNDKPLANSCSVSICSPPRISNNYALRYFNLLLFKNLKKW